MIDRKLSQMVKFVHRAFIYPILFFSVSSVSSVVQMVLIFHFPSFEIRRVASLRFNTDGCSFVPSPGPLGAVM